MQNTILIYKGYLNQNKRDVYAYLPLLKTTLTIER